MPIEEIRRLAEEKFSTSRGSHDWEHTQRVCQLCQRIGVHEQVDMTVLMIAAYLHDIGRSHQDRSNGAVCHAKQGARMAWDMVKHLTLTKQQKVNIVHCIRSHRYRGNHAPRTQEARVLFDADKLDAIGAVGVARAFLFAGEVGARLHSPNVNLDETKPYSVDDTGYREYQVKLRKIRHRMLTETGKNIAKGRHDFMVEFFKRFIREYDGKE